MYIKEVVYIIKYTYKHFPVFLFNHAFIEVEGVSLGWIPKERGVEVAPVSSLPAKRVCRLYTPSLANKWPFSLD